ncbi:SEC-C metal-binding domain-containing protein [Clostridium tagluense]|uniref:SEC-C metal-binding domain-containing protein n=1 Tax=Clostridium tagluense TaxID=360422 RepID=UPI00209BA1C3|nr:SEC-C metal-binding domain-containing protein [Clostridium tagluense]
MKNDVVNTRKISITKKEIQKELVVKSKFYSSSMIIKEVYCTNPMCECRDLTLKFLKVDEMNNEGEILFSIKLNIDTFKVLDKVSYDKAIKVDEIITEFLTGLDIEIRDRFNENYKISKGLEGEKKVKPISEKVVEITMGGGCVSFNEIFDNVETINFRDEKSNLIYIDDLYCMNPKCLCNEAYLSFIVVNELDNNGENVFTLRYRLKSGKYDVESKSCTDEYMNDILKAFNKEEKQMRENFKKRYKDMKVIGKQIHDKNKTNTAPQTATLQVGRNDICPCGSGKKYKKCCGC